jgi:hypothetical protein
VLGYVALSWTARFDMRLGEQISSLLYPLDTFSMYARPPSERQSLLVARDQRGRLHHVTDFRSFECGEPIAASVSRCSQVHSIRYLFEDLVRHIDTHAGPGEQEVDLITRTWEIRPGHPPEYTSDCIVAHCKVSR